MGPWNSVTPVPTSMGATAHPAITCSRCQRRHVQVSYLELCGKCLSEVYGPGGFEHHVGRGRLSPRQQADREQRHMEMALIHMLMVAKVHDQPLVAAGAVADKTP